MENTRVILADDHAIVRAGIRHILQRTPDIQVMGEASTGTEAIQLVNQLVPDVLLLDIEMPGLNGIEVARKLNATNLPVRILILSTYDDRQYITEILSHGAAGYLTKDEAPESIVEAIRSIARGEKGWVSERVRTKLKARTNARQLK